MTAEPDALRLVPVEPTPEMIEAGNRALSPWVAPAMHAEDAYRAMLAAALAVQPAAGRPIAWARRWFVDGVTPKKERNENGRMAWPKKFTYHEVTRSKVMKDDVALYAHPPAQLSGNPGQLNPPAQGSESGGDALDAASLLEAVCEYLLGEGPLRGRQFGDEEPPIDRKGRFWWRTDLREARDAVLAALSAPQAAPDPRVTEWGYSSTDEALTHLGKLLEDQAAFDGLAAPASGHDDHEDDEGRCDICGQAIKGSDLCATDVDLGPCHAACLEGAPVVDLETGEPDPDGKVFTYRWNDLPQPKAAPGEGEQS